MTASASIPFTASLNLSLANLPEGSYTFTNILKEKKDIFKQFKGFRGVYIWTHVESGKQYVGSSKDLCTRLKNYFSNPYLQTQSLRGSVICKAILSHGIESFNLSVHSLGPTPETMENYSSENLPDHVLLEQEYLDNYPFEYNVNRNASPSAYIPSTKSINVGEENPSYGETGESSFVWDRKHEDSLREQWSKDRGKNTFFLYSALNFSLVQVFNSASKLTAFFPDLSKRFGIDVKKMIIENSSPVRYLNYIISLTPLSPENLKAMFNDLPVKIYIPRKISTTGTKIYGFNPLTLEYKEWGSLEKCTFFLTGRKFENKDTVKKRIDKNILYHDYYLQTKPFKPS